MISLAQANRERGRTRLRRLSLSTLLVLITLLLWAAPDAHGQSFLINPIGDRNVAVGIPLAIQVTITDSNIPPAQLNYFPPSHTRGPAMLRPTAGAMIRS